MYYTPKSVHVKRREDYQMSSVGGDRCHGRLLRNGQPQGIKMGRRWLTKMPSFESCLQNGPTKLEPVADNMIVNSLCGF
jgi:hypothetical protein